MYNLIISLKDKIKVLKIIISYFNLFLEKKKCLSKFIKKLKILKL